tara:strand:- start:207 stop:419 length:213 start_codon:yes stop_codon:yes gene_type:complete
VPRCTTRGDAQSFEILPFVTAFISTLINQFFTVAPPNLKEREGGEGEGGRERERERRRYAYVSGERTKTD